MTATPEDQLENATWWTRQRRLRLLLAYVALLFTAPHWPGEWSGAEYGLQFNHLDKLVHLSAFGLLGWLLAWAWPLEPVGRSWRRLAGLWLLIAIYAAVDELLQPYVGRRCDPLDWVADVVGAAIGLWLRAWQTRSHQ